MNFYTLLLLWNIFIISVSVGQKVSSPYGSCGIRTEVGTRIVGGQVSFPGRWPWMAALFRRQSQYCAGALISDRHVLTAAHCISGIRPELVQVRLGDLELNDLSLLKAAEKNDSSPGKVRFYGVSRVVIHKDYEPRSHLHDIAVLRLNELVQFTPYIQRICLPPPSQVTFEDRMAVVAGWGTVTFLGSTSPWLREVEVPIWNNDACFNKLQKFVFNTTLCAGGKEKSADACQGDSGGPLMLQMGDGHWAAVGVVSWGIRCGDPDKPGVYTRTSYYTDWILNAVRTTY